MANPFVDFDQLGEPTPNPAPQAPRVTNPFAAMEAAQAEAAMNQQAAVNRTAPQQFQAAPATGSSPLSELSSPRMPKPCRLPPRYDRVLATKKLKQHVGKPVELEHRGNINATCIGDNGMYFTAGDTNLRQWNLSNGRCEQQIKIKEGKGVKTMVYNAGWVWCGREDGTVQGIKIATSEVKDMNALEDGVVALACAGKSNLWALSDAGALFKYDLRKGTVVFHVSLGLDRFAKRPINCEVRLPCATVTHHQSRAVDAMFAVSRTCRRGDLGALVWLNLHFERRDF